MNATISIILILSFIIVYAFLIQIYTVLFRITGMTKEKAKFQVVSLLTGCGYTTSESEIVTDDKIKRSIARAAMITGYAFSVIIVSLIINLLLNVTKEDQLEALIVSGISFGAFIVILIIFKIPFINRTVEKLIELIATVFLKRGNSDNVITLLDNYGKDAIVEVLIRQMPEFLDGKTIIESKIKSKYNMNVLVLKRKGKVIDVSKDTIIQVNDSIILFGSYQNIKDAFKKKVHQVEKVLDVIDEENVIDLLDNYCADAIAQITIHKLPSFMVGKRLIDNNLKDQYHINVLMIKRNEQIIGASKDAIICEGDSIIVFGPYANIKKVFKDI